MDELDYLILGELVLDPQISFLQLAKKLKISSFTIKSRYDKMLNEGMINKPVINIDLSKLGYQGKAFLLINNVPNQPKKNTVKAMKKIKNIIMVTEVIGPYDIFAVSPIVNFQGIRELISEVKKIPSVQRVNISCISDIEFPIKLDFGKTVSELSRDLAANTKK
jgi:Lrp/AsnC family transcriptional regulator, regulator for asnA, asnC and gidA